MPSLRKSRLWNAKATPQLLSIRLFLVIPKYNFLRISLDTKHPLFYLPSPIWYVGWAQCMLILSSNRSCLLSTVAQYEQECMWAHMSMCEYSIAWLIWHLHLASPCTPAVFIYFLSQRCHGKKTSMHVHCSGEPGKAARLLLQPFLGCDFHQLCLTTRNQLSLSSPTPAGPCNPWIPSTSCLVI